MAASNQDNGQIPGPIRHIGRGFASLDPERQREIVGHGGRAANERGVAHEFTPAETRSAGRKGPYAYGAHRGAHALGESGELPAAPAAAQAGRRA